jgi:soluble lytic murein transglycosylase-like protein
VTVAETAVRVVTALLASLAGPCLLAAAEPATAAVPRIAIGSARSALGQTAGPVQVTLGADGRKTIFNETPVQHERRFAGRLLPVPDLPGLPAGALEPLILRRSGEQNLDPRLVRAVIQVESGYNHRARSNKGAIGLMQLMPATARELGADPKIVEQNVDAGARYLRDLLLKYDKHAYRALAAYNAGPGAVDKYHGVPPYRETQAYILNVLRHWQKQSSSD